MYKTFYSDSLASIDKSELYVTLYANILCFAITFDAFNQGNTTT